MRVLLYITFRLCGESTTCTERWSRLNGELTLVSSNSRLQVVSLTSVPTIPTCQQTMGTPGSTIDFGV